MKLTKTVFFFIIFLISTNLKANEKLKIINKLNTIDNIQFNFSQKTNQRMENGNCVLVFPNKLKCNYKNKDQKELIVNKKMMAITQKRYGKTLFYPLSKSTFINILSKNELINIIKEGEIFVDDYFNIVFFNESNSKTLIRFNKNDFLLAGWVSKDQYNNEVIFKIEVISTNQIVNGKIFTLPSKN